MRAKSRFRRATLSAIHSVRYTELANILGKSRRSITTYFEELRGKGVCRIRPAVNQHQRSEVEICDEFWPYTKAETAAQPSERERFIALIQAFLSKRACVRCTFTVADEKYAADLLSRDVSFDQIQRAIALGCCRKYVSLLNGFNSEPINSLGYFRELIEEAEDSETPAGYWSYVMLELEHLEAKWLSKVKDAADAKLALAAASKAKQTR